MTSFSLGTASYYASPALVRSIAQTISKIVICPYSIVFPILFICQHKNLKEKTGGTNKSKESEGTKQLEDIWATASEGEMARTVLEE